MAHDLADSFLRCAERCQHLVDGSLSAGSRIASGGFKFLCQLTELSVVALQLPGLLCLRTSGLLEVLAYRVRYLCDFVA